MSACWIDHLDIFLSDQIKQLRKVPGLVDSFICFVFFFKWEGMTVIFNYAITMSFLKKQNKTKIKKTILQFSLLSGQMKTNPSYKDHLLRICHILSKLFEKSETRFKMLLFVRKGVGLSDSYYSKH